MKKIIGFIVAAGILFFSQQVCLAASLKFAHINLAAIFKGYKKVIDSNKKLEEQKNKVRNIVGELQNLQKNYDSLSDEEKALRYCTEEGKKEREEQLKVKQEDIYKNCKEIKKEENRILTEVLQDIEKVSSELRKKKKLTYIFDDRLIIAGPEEMDITKELINLLNDKMNKK